MIEVDVCRFPGKWVRRPDIKHWTETVKSLKENAPNQRLWMLSIIWLKREVIIAIRLPT